MAKKRPCKSIKMLPKCPHCGNLIDHLEVSSFGSFSEDGELYMDDDFINWSDRNDEDVEAEYHCPECNADLEFNYHEACEFMKSNGGKKKEGDD